MDIKRHFSKLGLMYFLGTLIIYGVQIVTGVLAGILFPQALESTDMAFLLSMFPMYVIGMPLMVLLIRLVPAERIEKKKMTAGQWVIAFLMCYAIMYLSNIAGQITTWIIGLIKGRMVVDAMALLASNISPWAAILTMVLIAPAAEEYLFRRMLIDRTVRYGEGLAVILSALMFGLFHGNLNQFAYAFTLGMMLGFIYVKTGKIRYTVFLHMLINFLGSVMSIWVLKASGYEELVHMMNSGLLMENVMSLFPKMFIMLAYVAVLIGLVIAGTVLLIVKRKQFVCNHGVIVIPKGKRFSTVILNAGMLLFVIFWLVMMVIQLLS